MDGSSWGWGICEDDGGDAVPLEAIEVVMADM